MSLTRCYDDGVPAIVQRLDLVEVHGERLVRAAYFDGSVRTLWPRRVPWQVHCDADFPVRSVWLDAEAEAFWRQAEIDAEILFHLDRIPPDQARQMVSFQHWSRSRP